MCVIYDQIRFIYFVIVIICYCFGKNIKVIKIDMIIIFVKFKLCGGGIVKYYKGCNFN